MAKDCMFSLSMFDVLWVQEWINLIWIDIMLDKCKGIQKCIEMGG